MPNRIRSLIIFI